MTSGAHGIDTVEELGVVLRQLRRRAARQRGDSQLTYRELAARTGWAHGVIGAYFAGKTLPPTDRFDVLVRLLGATSAEQGVLATARDRVEECRRARGASGTRAASPPAKGTRHVPRELPPDLPHLAGRIRELATLSRLCPQEAPGSTVIVALDGPAGVGKSALAVRAAHRVADRFPHGQLYVDLQGAALGSRPLEPTAVLARLSRTLGLQGPPPDSESAAVAAFRALTADRRLLVVLDNALDAAQVRPLLPAAPGCAVLVTSRRVLATLNGAAHLHLGRLSPAEALSVLGALAGHGRLIAEPQAAELVARQCDHLPLALRIAGARLAARPHWPLHALAERLSDARHRLDELEYADLRVRASFQAGYRTLLDGGSSDRCAAEALPLLARSEDSEDSEGSEDGVLGSQDAARILLLAPRFAEPLLERLVDAQLLESSGPGRYRIPPLLRLFALEQPGSRPAPGRHGLVNMPTPHAQGDASACLRGGTPEPT
ncbi:NB-ARC domain-containing protein [Actinomycetota bacterium Odt1-20B]